MRKDLLEKVISHNLYDDLVKGGIIPININCWMEMYRYYSTRMLVNAEFKDCKSRAYTEAAEEFNVSDMTIMRAVKFMES